VERLCKHGVNMERVGGTSEWNEFVMERDGL
jgi:hypothetical protein